MWYIKILSGGAKFAKYIKIWDDCGIQCVFGGCLGVERFTPTPFILDKEIAYEVKARVFHRS